MKTCYLVFGPESTGTRMLTRALIRMGCTGDDGHAQRLDRYPHHRIEADCTALNTRALAEMNTHAVVWRRSFPHGVRSGSDRQRWPRVADIIQSLQSVDVTCHVIITVRDLPCTLRSQVARKGISAQRSRQNIRRAYADIFAGIATVGPTVPFTLSCYESIILNGEACLVALAKELGLTWPAAPDFEIIDADCAHYSR